MQKFRSKEVNSTSQYADIGLEKQRAKEQIINTEYSSGTHNKHKKTSNDKLYQHSVSEISSVKKDLNRVKFNKEKKVKESEIDDNIELVKITE